MSERLQAKTTTGTDVKPTTICRTVKVEIEETSRYSGKTGKMVTVTAPPKERVPMSELLGVLLPGKKVEHVGRGDLMKVNWRPSPSSQFFQAVHTCFDKHHALTLRPEVLMHLIVHEIAVTVKQNPEAYRALFTRSDEKTRIDVRHDGLVLGDPSSPWNEAIALFDPKLREAVPPGIMEHLLPPFTTATMESQTASLVAFMDAASPFYDYHVHTLCGIPEIRLAGVPEDYRRMAAAAAQLAEVFRPHLGRYFDHLLPVLATLSSQAAGAPQDDAFWRSIYKFESHSGTHCFNGWITAFVNYVQTAEVPKSQYSEGSVGQVVPKADDLYDWTQSMDKHDFNFRGIDIGSVPSQICAVPFVWNYLGEEKKMLFAGGPLGVEEHEGSVMPTLSYAVLHAE